LRRHAVSETGLTRREALKRGALIAGAAWAIPVVQAVGLRPAYAQTTSVECHHYCIRWIEGSGWHKIPGGDNNVLDCPVGALNELPPCIEDFTVVGSKTTEYTVTFPQSCKFESGDPSPDPFNAVVVGVKCNSGAEHSYQYNAVAGEDNTILISTSDNCPDDSILYFEMIIKCCCG
jgi:hypothetical protein